jgi:subtilisin family serine protease
MRLEGLDIRDGSFHAWIERDDPRRIGRLGERQAWVFPSFFAEGTFVDDSTVSSLACGQRIISVANLDDVIGRIHPTSSQGPTRDGRLKPDVAAPGTRVLAANGFTGDPDAWLEMTGTSMASPYVTGVVGLMLSARKDLTAAQIEGILRRTAVPLPGTDYSWRNSAGFGVINSEACLEEAVRVSQRVDLTDST